MPPPDSRKLTCTACQHENEIERVYCHNCGEKLDRSLLPKADITKPSEDKAKVARKVKKMMDPNRFNWWLNFKTLLLVEFLAVFVAVGYLIVQAPPFVQPIEKDKLSEVNLGEVWAEVTLRKQIEYKEFDVNYHLNKAMRDVAGTTVKFDRAFAHFEKDLITVGTQRSVLGLSLTNTAAFTPVRDGAKWKADVRRFAIGRLTIPHGLAKLLNLDAATTGAFAQAFDKDLKMIDRLGKIEPGEGTIKLTARQQQ